MSLDSGSSSPVCADRTSDVLALYRLYDAFNARDIAGTLAGLHAAVDWPNGWEGGTVRGVAAVEAYWRRQFSAIDPQVTPQAVMIEDDGRLSVRVHQVVRGLDGALLSDGIVHHLYRMADGLVLAMEIRRD